MNDETVELEMDGWRKLLQGALINANRNNTQPSDWKAIEFSESVYVLKKLNTKSICRLLKNIFFWNTIRASVLAYTFVLIRADDEKTCLLPERRHKTVSCRRRRRYGPDMYSRRHHFNRHVSWKQLLLAGSGARS